MTTGFDTGFFVRLLEDDATAVQVWESAIESGEGMVSCLTMFELRRLGRRGAIDSKSVDVLIAGLPSVCKIIWLDSEEILSRAARLSSGTGIPAMDSLILAGFEYHHAGLVYSTERHLERYKTVGMTIISL